MSSSAQIEEDTELRCRGCKSASLFLDWKAGDRICTNCGIVDEERIRDTRPEWTDYNDADDLAKGLPSLQRCSLIPNDETKYVGGLQPTILSRNIFGHDSANCATTTTSGSTGMSTTRLLKTHRKINRMMDKFHANKLREMEYSRKLKRSNKDFGIKEEETTEEERGVTIADSSTSTCIRTKKGESYNNALTGSKWSLDRAIMLHGSYEEFLILSTQKEISYNQYCQEKDELSRQLSPLDKKASQEVYHAYLLTIDSVRQLSLPTHFIAEYMDIICKYAMKRNGFHVKGIATRYDISNEEEENLSTSAIQEKKLQIKHKNKIYQIASLSSAVIYISAKANGYAKSLSHVCSTFVPTQVELLVFVEEKNDSSLVKPKSCSKALVELQLEFPIIFQSLLSPAVEVVNLVQSTTSSLDLPIIAVDVIREVVRYIAKQQQLDKTISTHKKKQDNGKLVTICAACTYFVCCAGEVMQRLAAQALKQQQQQQQSLSGRNLKKRCRSSSPIIMPSKKLLCSSTNAIIIKQENSSLSTKITPLITPEPADIKQEEEVEDILLSPEIIKQEETQQPEITTSLVSLTSKSKFDVFSVTTPPTSPNKKSINPTIQQGWYTWNNRLTKKWNRSIQKITQSSHCTASSSAVLQFYQYKLFPIREQILNIVQESFLRRKEEEFFCGLALVDIKIVAPLMKSY